MRDTDGGVRLVRKSHLKFPCVLDHLRVGVRDLDVGDRRAIFGEHEDRTPLPQRRHGDPGNTSHHVDPCRGAGEGVIDLTEEGQPLRAQPLERGSLQRRSDRLLAFLDDKHVIGHVGNASDGAGHPPVGV